MCKYNQIQYNDLPLCIDLQCSIQYLFILKFLAQVFSKFRLNNQIHHSSLKYLCCLFSLFLKKNVVITTFWIWSFGSENQFSIPPHPMIIFWEVIHRDVWHSGMYRLFFDLLFFPAHTLYSFIHTHDPYPPLDKVQERWMGRGIPLAVSPHPETCQPCRCKLAGIGHS